MVGSACVGRRLHSTAYRRECVPVLANDASLASLMQRSGGVHAYMAGALARLPGEGLTDLAQATAASWRTMPSMIDIPEDAMMVASRTIGDG